LAVHDLPLREPLRVTGARSTEWRRVSAVEDEHIPVGVIEEAHEAHASVDGLAEKPHPFRNEPLPRDAYVGHTFAIPAVFGEKGTP
jgi:hypothetical protein